MNLERGLHRRPDLNPVQVGRQLEADGWGVLFLPSGIVDQQSFFRGVRDAVPLDPPVLSDDNWDALSDSLWSGLYGLKSEKIALIWPESTDMNALAPDDFETAIAVLSDLADSLADRKATVGRPKQVIVVVT